MKDSTTPPQFSIVRATDSSITPSSPSTTPLYEQDSHEDFFRCSTHRWVINEEKNLDLRYVRFNVSEMQAIAAETVGAKACTLMEKIAEGSFNKIFCLGFDNGSEVIVRIPCPIVGNSRLVVASEAAILTFAREYLQLPVPKVLASSRNRDFYNDVGTEFLILEKISGVPLHSSIDHLVDDSAELFVREFLRIEEKVASVNFSQIGSLYFKEDVEPALQMRPLFAPGTPRDAVSDRYCIGPTVQREFWRNEREHMSIDRGPWPDLKSYVQAIINRERNWLKSYARPRPKDDPLFLSETENNIDTHLGLLERLELLLPHFNFPQPMMTLKLWHPDLHPSNILVTPDDCPTIAGIIDWQHALILPYLLQVTFPPIFLYRGGLIEIQEAGVQETVPDIATDQSPEMQAKFQHHLKLAKRHKAFLNAVRETNEPRLQIMGSRLQRNFTLLLHAASRSWSDGAYILRNQLMDLYYDWPVVAGPDVPYPLEFSAEECEVHDTDTSTGDYWNYRRYALFEEAGCNPDGLVTPEKYEQVIAFFENRRKDWVPERMGPWPLQDGTWSSYL